MEKPWFSPELKDELKGLRYPLYYADIETVNPAIPRFAGMRPYDHLPEPGAAPEHLNS